MGKKKAKRPATVEEAQQAASEIAKGYGNFQCDACAREIASGLGKNSDATFERLRTSDRSDVIGLAQEGIQISTNGVHVGVRIGEKIFDNHYHEGVTAAQWMGRFLTATDAPLVRQSRPIQEFFGKIFLVKQFNRWLLES
jgi:hypothetical protein